MHRNAMAKLIDWNNDPSRKPLIVNGARQVGKTWLIRKFAAEHFESIAHVVFLDNGEMKQLFETKTIFEGDRLFTEYKGVYAEQYVCQQLVANGYVPHYWSADGKQRKGEVDFLIEHEGRLWPIEVKAGGNIAGGSLAAFVKRYEIDRALRFSTLGWKDQGWLVNIPLYAADCLPAFLGENAD